MNLILCDQHCRHQREGYCALNQITQLTGVNGAKCGYFEDIAKPGEQGASAEYPHGLTNIANWD